MTRNTKSKNIDTADQVRSLDELGKDELRQRWLDLYKTAPAPRISRDLLIRGVTFRIQEDAQGGLGKSCQRQLQRLAETLRVSGKISATQGQSFKLGTKLIREWRGRVHEVIVADGTYIWAGKHHRSLTQIARAITGTRWSGPRFFGLEAGQQTSVKSQIEDASNKKRSRMLSGAAVDDDC